MATPADSFRLFRAFRRFFIAAGREPIRTANPGELGQRSSFPLVPRIYRGFLRYLAVETRLSGSHFQRSTVS